MTRFDEVLQKVSFFSNLDETGTSFIADRLEFQEFARGERLCEIGDPGDKLFIVIKGKIKVVVYADNVNGKTPC